MTSVLNNNLPTTAARAVSFVTKALRPPQSRTQTTTSVSVVSPYNWNRNGIIQQDPQPVQEIHKGFSGVYLHRLDPIIQHPDMPSVYKFGCARDIANRLCEHASEQHNPGQLHVECVMIAEDYYALERHGIGYLSTLQSEQWAGKRPCTREGSVPRKELFEIEDVEAFRNHLRTFADTQELPLEVLGTSQSVIGKHLVQLFHQSVSDSGPHFRLVPGERPLRQEELRTRRAHYEGGVPLEDVVYLTKTGKPRLQPRHAFSFTKQNGKHTRYNLSDLRYDLKLGVVCVQMVEPELRPQTSFDEQENKTSCEHNLPTTEQPKGDVTAVHLQARSTSTNTNTTQHKTTPQRKPASPRRRRAVVTCAVSKDASRLARTTPAPCNNEQDDK